MAFVLTNYFFSDIDECELNIDNCTDGATCLNTLGSFSCICSPGSTGLTCEEGMYMYMYIWTITNLKIKLQTKLLLQI